MAQDKLHARCFAPIVGIACVDCFSMTVTLGRNGLFLRRRRTRGGCGGVCQSKWVDADMIKSLMKFIQALSESGPCASKHNVLVRGGNS